MTFAEQYAYALQRAAENVENHTPEEISVRRNENGDFREGIIRFTRNGSSCYGFDLAISRFGIAMYGDCDSLVFRVGSSYGTEFLARKSVDGYMISKLEEEFRKKTELDEDALRALLCSAGLRLVERWTLDTPLEWFDDARDSTPKPEQLDSLLEWMDAAMKLDEDAEGAREYNLFLDAVEDVIHPNLGILDQGLQAVERHLYDNSGDLNLGDCEEITQISKHSDRLVEKLEMLRICAHKWEEQERERTRNQTDPGTAG